MIEGGRDFFEHVLRVSNGARLSIETRVDCEAISPICWGTPDAWSFDPNTMRLDVFDYKFGHGFVDEFENLQLATYASGIIDQLSRETGEPFGVLDQKIKVVFHIVQPRCYYKGQPIRSWSCRASDLRPVWNALSAAAFAATGDAPKATTNFECIHCSGRHACQALQRAAYSDAEVATEGAPVILQPSAASLELLMLSRALERLQARVDGLREVVLIHIKGGHSVPHWVASQSNGRTVWSYDHGVVAAMGDLMGVQLRKSALVTPTQAIKLGIDEAVIKAYSSQQSGSIRLDPATSTDARRTFGNN
jgi:hypothetical protein